MTSVKPNMSPIEHSTFTLKRTIPNTIQKVFEALSNSASKRKWFADSDSHNIEQFEMDFKIGGEEHFRYQFKEGTPFAGVEIANHGVFLEIKEDSRIVSASTMTLGGNLISASLVSFELFEADGSTELVCTLQNAFFEGSDGTEIRKAGWTHLLNKLEKELSA